MAGCVLRTSARLRTFIGDDHLFHPDALERALLAWPEAPTWALTLGDDPHQALPLLREMLAG